MYSVGKRHLFFSNSHDLAFSPDLALFGVEIHQVALALMVEFIQIVLEKHQFITCYHQHTKLLWKLPEETTSGKSLINKTKNSVPRIDPCSTRAVISVKEDE